MAGHHGFRIANGSQIDAVIPARQLGQERCELVDALRGQLLAERGNAVRDQLRDFFDRRACLSSVDIKRGKLASYATSNAMKSSTAIAASFSRSAQRSASSCHCRALSLVETLLSNFFCRTGMPSSRRCR